MFVEEYGSGNEKIIVMLHGANFVHSFGRQYVLADKYHIIVPHIMGYGNEAHRMFDTEKCTAELAHYIGGLGRKVLLVGFSLGAQLGYKLVSEHSELFTGAILVSPWLIKEEPMLSEVMSMNEKQLASFKKKWLCNIIGFMNGLPAKQRKEFVRQMQEVTPDTVRSSVDNGITLDSIKGFENVDIPVVALAGSKEQAEVRNSVIGMAEKNPRCRYEIWDKAAHNIPPMFSGRFNELICDMIDR